MISSARPLRADAARNRELLLAAAEEEFAARGIDASIADIADRAGVAKATVFSHFASKEELIAAIVGNHFAELTVVARRLLTSADPEAALSDFLTEAAHGIKQQDLTFLRADDDSRVTELRNDLHEAVSALVDRARAAGVVRAEITGTDVFLLICAPVHIAGCHPDADPDLWRRYQAIIFDGLRPTRAELLPQPPPSWP
ncbi:TetR/AcrR family transcriptional regulator [Aeromicrobium endophyticum]|uniref:TetR/AcrR family transcriptional regulator n=1 Tax=Aeromicrobium endophyticum TaxID=2292704 RepID=A0A371PAD2_9ACTN|nr:TetR/AcrR family transcriptional regulator [Aeromicrobium endophyticum]REK72915.1 TetR/AcrR family transcriptional regulator [Aeromicrobium endophyticum]